MSKEKIYICIDGHEMNEDQIKYGYCSRIEQRIECKNCNDFKGQKHI